MERPTVKLRKQELLYIIAVEGKNQEKLYFERVENLINEVEKRKYDIKFDFVEPFGGDPKCIVERAINKSIGKSNKAAVFDYDGKTSKYEEAIDLGIENNIDLGYSNYSFDLWLIWHKVDFNKCVISQNEYESKVKSVFGLSPGKNIKKEKIVININSQIALKDIFNAIDRADKNQEYNKNNNTAIITAKGNKYYSNPDTRIHEILKEILEKTCIL